MFDKLRAKLVNLIMPVPTQPCFGCDTNPAPSVLDEPADENHEYRPVPADTDELYRSATDPTYLGM